MGILGHRVPIQSVFGRCRLFAATFAAVMLCAGAGPAQDRPTDYQVKAAFLEKFGKFVEWPERAFGGPAAPVVIGVFGDNPFGDALRSFAETDTINGRPVFVREIKTFSDLTNCHVIFVPASESAANRDVLAAAAGLPVLTVGETDEFFDAGGMIEFIIENKQVHFRIRNEAARAAGLKISSKLLILARRAGP